MIFLFVLNAEESNWKHEGTIVKLPEGGCVWHSLQCFSCWSSAGKLDSPEPCWCIIRGAPQRLRVIQHLQYINPESSPEPRSAESACKCTIEIYTSSRRFGWGMVWVLPMVWGHFLLFYPTCSGPRLALASTMWSCSAGLSSRLKRQCSACCWCTDSVWICQGSKYNDRRHKQLKKQNKLLLSKSQGQLSSTTLVSDFCI